MRRSTKVLEQYAEAQVLARAEKLSARLRESAKHPRNVEAIHDLRVSIRRFRQCLRVFSELFEPKDVKRMTRPLRKIMDLCGAVRNCDVAAEVLKAAGAPDSPEIARRLKQRRAEAVRDLRKRLADWSADGAEQTWKNMLRAEAREDESVEANSRRVLLPLAEEFFKTGEKAAEPGRTPEELHPFRLLAKRFRYTLEIYGPVAGSGWRKGIECVRGLQDALGAINDCVTTADLLADPGAKDPDLRRSKAALRRLQRQRIAAFRVYWQESFTGKNREWWSGWLGERESGPPAAAKRASVKTKRRTK